MTEIVESQGWMGCAVQSKDGDFMVAQISDDVDGVSRFHIDRERRFGSAEDALKFAYSSRGSLSYRGWDHTYRIEKEPPLKWF